MTNDVKEFLGKLAERNPGQTEFQQTVADIAKSVWPFIAKNPKYQQAKILARLAEPERVIQFRVTWTDRQGDVQINRGYRVQMNGALGPYTGGLRFSPGVNLSLLKSLAFDQVFKNALTTFPLGGGYGGADFDPDGKTDEEVMRFCHAFMNELYRHIGSATDVLAGDVGVSEREIGYLFGQYRKLANEFDSALTGKGIHWSGTRLRAAATGYGLVYFVEEMLATAGTSLKGKTVAISGTGGVAQSAAEKAVALGGKVVTFSDADGFVYDPAGMDAEKLAFVKELKNVQRGSLREYAKKYRCQHYDRQRPWGVKCDVALPCTGHHELGGRDAERLTHNGCLCVAEGIATPVTPEAVNVFLTRKILYAPGKVANTGGVVAGGLELSQNSLRYQWSHDEVDKRLWEVMQAIHKQCVRFGKQDDFIHYVDGANIAGFRKVAEAMLDQGLV